MRILVVEDDFVSRRLLQEVLTKYGNCDVAVNGNEAIQAFKLAWKENKDYDVIFLDIMMPEMDGQEVLREIRKLEKERGVGGFDGVKIIMVTSLGDHENIKEAFREQCEAYLIKPIDKIKLVQTMKDLGLIQHDG